MNRFKYILSILFLILVCSCEYENLFLINGKIESQSGNYKKAIKLFKKGLSSNPSTPKLFHFEIAKCYYGLEEYEFAETELEKVIYLDKNYSDAYWVMARIYSRKNDPEKSIKFYSKAIEIKPNSELLASRAHIYLREGKNELALKDLNKAVHKDPTNPFALSNRGLAYIRLQKNKEAEIDLNKSIEIDPNNPYAYKHKGLLYLELLDTIEACKNFKISKKKGYYKFGDEIDKNEVNELLKQHCE